jgi:hypothetical protein
MVWWQITLFVLGALTLAILGGVFLGRFIFRLWPQHSYRERERDRQLNKYIETHKINSKTGKLSLEEAWETKLQLESNTNKKKPDLQVNQTNSIKLLSEKIRKESFNIPKTISIVNPLAFKESLAKERGERAAKGEETLARIEAAVRIKEADSREKSEIDHKVTEITTLNTNIAEKVTVEAITKTLPEVKQHNASQNTCLNEITANLRIATTPWTGTPLLFVTSTMDKHSDEFDAINVQNHDDLREAYTDMAMANNIVWLVTELGASSKELGESYVKLCAKIAERLHKILRDNP